MIRLAGIGLILMASAASASDPAACSEGRCTIIPKTVTCLEESARLQQVLEQQRLITAKQHAMIVDLRNELAKQKDLLASLTAATAEKAEEPDARTVKKVKKVTKAKTAKPRGGCKPGRWRNSKGVCGRWRK